MIITNSNAFHGWIEIWTPEIYLAVNMARNLAAIKRNPGRLDIYIKPCPGGVVSLLEQLERKNFPLYLPLPQLSVFDNSRPNIEYWDGYTEQIQAIHPLLLAEKAANKWIRFTSRVHQIVKIPSITEYTQVYSGEWVTIHVDEDEVYHVTFSDFKGEPVHVMGIVWVYRAARHDFQCLYDLENHKLVPA